MSDVPLDVARDLMRRLHSGDEATTTGAADEVLILAHTGYFTRTIDELDRLQKRVAELESERELALDLDSDNQEEVGMLHARVAELEGAIRTVQWEHWTLRAGNVSCCHTCGACPCATRLELDAVLPPKEEQA